MGYFSDGLIEDEILADCEYEWLHLDIDNLVKEMEGK